MHAGHGLIETAAAIVLTLGGAAILARAWLERGRLRRRTSAAPFAAPAPTPAPIGRRSADGLAALLSFAAAAIHLAAGPEHVETLGDLGLGFYWAALVQGAFAVAWLLTERSPRLAVLGIAVNAVLIAAWAWSRTVGVGIPGAPEAIGVADGVTIVLEVMLIAILASALPPRLPHFAVSWRVPVASAAVAIGGVAVLATAIALVDIGGGHDHAAGAWVQAAHDVTP